MLYAVVVNYRTPDDLEGFLASWKAHAPDWAHLTIVNVDPLEQDIAIAAAGIDDVIYRVGKIAIGTTAHIRVDNMTYYQYSENIGYAKACNNAAMNAPDDADVFAFFNADTRIGPGVIEPLYLSLMSHDDWGVIGPRQVNDDGLITHAGIVGTNTKPKIRGWMQPDNPGFCDILDDCVSVMGSAYFVKRECWEELYNCPIYREQHPEATGAFLPTQHYYEETFCSYHATHHDWKVVYYGLVKMIHRWHKASPVGGFADKLFSESQRTFRAMCDAHGIERD
jgi:GT2 family glycosyltransferase